jgi:hypothetical protein
MQLQIDLNGATAGANAGMFASALNAEKATPEWSVMAHSYLRSFLDEYPTTPFMAIDVRKYAHNQHGLPLPPDPRAWGIIIRDAKSLGVIKRARWGLPAHTHGAPVSVWVKS